ncbi:MAG: protein kinase [Deltaproteobacteria bacterium]|nr:protein kinase [Deltaproteobacteria bacterium]
MDLCATLTERFTVLSEVASGGTATVFHARDTRDGAAVALKVSRGLDATSRRLLLREARLLAELRLPGVVAHRAHGVTPEGRAWLAQEWLPGESLEERLRRGPVPLAEALALARSLCRTLALLHASGVLHGDLTPANARVVCDTELCLVDLGLGGQVGGRFVPGGTPGALAPERLRDPALRSVPEELYSLGCLLFELFTNRAPFVGPSPLAVTASVLLDPAPSPRGLRPELPRALEGLLRRLLSHTPEARPGASSVLAALTALVAASSVGQATKPRPVSEPGALARRADVLSRRGFHAEARAHAQEALERAAPGSRAFYLACEALCRCAAARRDLPALDSALRAVLQPAGAQDARRQAVLTSAASANVAADVGLPGLADEASGALEAATLRAPRGDLVVSARLHRLAALKGRLRGDGPAALVSARGAVASARRARDRQELAACARERSAAEEIVHARTILLAPPDSIHEQPMNPDTLYDSQRSFEHEPSPVLLLVDGDPDRRAVLREFLGEEATVHEAGSYDEALQVAEASAPAVVLVRQELPGPSGLELASELGLRLSEEAAVLLLVAPSEAPAASAAVREARLYGLLKDPWQPDELLALVTQARWHVQQRRALTRLAEFLAEATLRVG